MNAKKFVIGVDFGTQSGRVVLVDVEHGEETACVMVEYPDGVIVEQLPENGCRLGVDWALQNPDDYLEVLRVAIPGVLKKAGADSRNVIGVGIDFTSCTMLPISSDGQALCQISRFRDQPHAWVKLWKHHAAQDEANQMNRIANERCEDFLRFYGGKVSSEWMIPKIWQILSEAPEIYAATECFMEAGDWIVLQLTGRIARSSCMAGYKACWNQQSGYPNKHFLKSLDDRLENLAEEKLYGDILPIGQKAGVLTDAAAAWTGLQAGTPVAVANIDAHAAVPATGVAAPGSMVMIMGTSTCHMALSDQLKNITGVSGVVADGIAPGFYGYEAGQVAVGDIFDWFAETCVPTEYQEAAKANNLSIHQWLENKAAALLPGESGVIALDWWNGVRTPLVDADLSGLLLGMTLQTKPEEIYRALIEATAFGTRLILDTYENAGISIDRLVACGGLPGKNRLLVQIYADVTGKDIHVAAATQASALGAAMFGAVAAGKANGGYDSIADAAKAMANIKEVYHPLPENVERYKILIEEYKALKHYFGEGGNDVMKRLKELRCSTKKTKR